MLGTIIAHPTDILTNQKYIMKKTILSVALLFTLLCCYGFADPGEKDISDQVKASFRQAFVTAEAVNWQDLGAYVKASFRMCDQTLAAYYSPEGDFLAMTRNISAGQLPIHLLMLVREKYPRHWITDLFEMYTDGETSYFITINDGGREKVLKAGSGGRWEVFRSRKVKYSGITHE